jgi:lipopolysaccharide biosynthesis regulator YciM
METLSFFLLIFCAIGIGWLLGYRARKKTETEASRSKAFHEQYYKGLNYLLNDQPDAAIDTFIQTLEVSSDTLETHLALGNLMRRKGEVERAIRIHQNLLSRPSLPKHQLHQAHLELARDYVSAGLLDRAERLLSELVVESDELREVAQWHLLDVYQNERDWDKAIETARQLKPKKLPGKDRELSKSSAHFYCEKAIRALRKKDYRQVKALVKQALLCDRDCVRASLIGGQMNYEMERYKPAIKSLKRIRQQDPDFVSESIDLLRKCYCALEDIDGLLAYLNEFNEEHPSVSVMLAIAELLKECEGEERAEAFIASQLKTRPSLRGLDSLIDIHVNHASGRARENLTILQKLVQRLIASKPVFKCATCGFAGKQQHWFCPGCKHWGSIKPIQGLEGD